MNHLRAVPLDKHNKFATDNGMYSYFVSAKTGDGVNTAFYRVAADLAGVVLTKPEIEVQTKVVEAQIVNHDQNNLQPVKGPSSSQNPPKSSGCTIQ